MKYPFYLKVKMVCYNDSDDFYAEYTWQKVNNENQYNQILKTLEKLEKEDNRYSFETQIFKTKKSLVKEIVRLTAFNWRFI